MTEKKLMKILVADDDEDDQLLIKDAFEECRVLNPIEFVNDGLELIQLLKREGPYANRTGETLPGLILLDLNMPRMDGREALKIIKEDSSLKRIPVVILTTSRDEEDIVRTYDTGVNSFITKPVVFDKFLGVVRTLQKYWIEIVELPTRY